MSLIANVVSLCKIRLRFTLFCCAGIFAFVNHLAGQDFGAFADGMPTMKVLFSRLFQDTPEFSTKANFGIFNAQGTLKMGLPMNLILTSNCMRQDIEVMGIAQIPAEQRQAMKQAHLDRIVILTRMDAKTVYIAFPGVKAYSSLPIRDEVLKELGREANDVTIQKSELGQETVKGHPCTKTKLTILEPGKPTETAFLWNAPELQSIPLKMEFYANNRIVQFQFADVQTRTRRETLFEIPTNYSRYPNDAAIIKYATDKYRNSTNPSEKGSQ